jgi:hypothetical protein
MANYLTYAINQFLRPEWSVLDLCCGNGLVSDGFTCSSITGVDVYRPYLNQYLQRVRNSSVLELDLADIARGSTNIRPQSYDAVVCADGVEHLDRDASEALIKWMEGVARTRVIIFTPLNVNQPGEIVLNTPHNAWGIDGGDDWQAHRCGYEPGYFFARGYSAYRTGIYPNAYDGTPYAEMLYVKELEQPVSTERTRSVGVGALG